MRGVSFRRLFNSSWGVDQFTVRTENPPSPGAQEMGVTTVGSHVATCRLPRSLNTRVTYREGFEVEDGQGGKIAIYAEKILPIDDAAKLLEERTKHARLIREKEDRIARLQAEIKVLRGQA